MTLWADVFFVLDMPNAFDVRYWPLIGDYVDTVAFIDEGVEFYPGDIETAVAETRTEITFRSDHVTCAARGDSVVVGNKTYTVKDILEKDDFSVLDRDWETQHLHQ